MHSTSAMDELLCYALVFFSLIYVLFVIICYSAILFRGIKVNLNKLFFE